MIDLAMDWGEGLQARLTSERASAASFASQQRLVSVRAQLLLELTHTYASEIAGNICRLGKLVSVSA